MDKLKGSLQTSLKQSPNLSESSYARSLAKIRSLLWSDLNTSTSHAFIHAVQWYRSSQMASLLVDETKLEDALQESQNASQPPWGTHGARVQQVQGTHTLSALTLSLNISPHITMTYLLIQK